MTNIITVDQALNIIKTHIKPLLNQQTVILPNALEKTVSEDVISPMNVPVYQNSAMDGYAIIAEDIPLQGNKKLNNIGTAFAGNPFHGRLSTGECIRIMTGAKIPQNADTVVEQEKVTLTDDHIIIGTNISCGQNIRAIGEDISKGSIVLSSGEVVGPAQLGVLASLGIASIKIRRNIKVAIFSSGDEIRSIGETLNGSQIYDSNRYTITGMLNALKVEVIDMGIVADNKEAITDALTEAAIEADLIITSGGVSVGDADFIKQCLDNMGQSYFTRLHLKPGRPLTFGHINNTPFFGLPGNPVAVMVTFMYFVIPAIKLLMGHLDYPLIDLKVPCLSALKKLPGRTEIQRGILENDPQSGLVVKSSGKQGSGVLSSMSKGNCFIYLGDDEGTVKPGVQVIVHPFKLFF